MVGVSPWTPLQKGPVSGKAQWLSLCCPGSAHGCVSHLGPWGRGWPLPRRGPRIPTRWPPLSPGQPGPLTTLSLSHRDGERGTLLRPPTSTTPVPILPAHAQGRPTAPHLTQGLSLVPWGMAPGAWPSPVTVTNTTGWGLTQHLLVTVPEAASPEWRPWQISSAEGSLRDIDNAFSLCPHVGRERSGSSSS